MRVPTRAGVLTQGSGFQFVGASVSDLTSTSQVLAIPGTEAVGDLCFVCVAAYGSDTITITSGSGGAWTKSTVNFFAGGYYGSVLYRTLTAGDVGANITVNTPNGDSSCVIGVYRGATTVAVKSTVADGGSDPLLTGFTKNAACKGILTFVLGRDYTNNPSPPGTFASRAGPGNFQYFLSELADITNPSNYTNGTDVTWTGVGATANAGWLIELT